MPSRKIDRSPADRNYYLVDACFLVNRYIPVARITDRADRKRIEDCQLWWNEIDQQMDRRKARVYVPNICIAEAFKVLSKKYYQNGLFRRPVDYKRACDALRGDMHFPAKKARASNRNVLFHDIEITRDVVISVDRFFEKAHKLNVNVGIVDLLLLATAKYLLDFLGFTLDDLRIVTIDKKLYKLARSLQDVPYTYDPTESRDIPRLIFTGPIR